MRPPGHRRERTTFLTLPRELRQKFLHLSFDNTKGRNIEFNICLIGLRIAFGDRRRVVGAIRKKHLPHTAAWAHTLTSINATVTEDLGYVLRNIIRDLEWRTSVSSCIGTAMLRRHYDRWIVLAGNTGMMDLNGVPMRINLRGELVIQQKSSIARNGFRGDLSCLKWRPDSQLDQTMHLKQFAPNFCRRH